MEQQWLGFALRQAARAAPHPAPASLQQHSAAAGYRLTLSFLESMPLFQADDRTFDVRVGVNLFDEAAGCFFGPTAHSAAVEYDMRRSKGWVLQPRRLCCFKVYVRICRPRKQGSWGTLLSTGRGLGLLLAQHPNLHLGPCRPVPAGGGDSISTSAAPSTCTHAPPSPALLPPT